MVRRWWLAPLPFLFAACGGSHDSTGGTVTPPGPAPVATVVVSGPASSLNVGATLQLTATLRDAAGNALTGRTVVWGSTNATVASVTSDGLVTGLTDGTATVSATSEGKVGFVGLAVIPVGAATVTVTPPVASLTPGDSVQLSATVKDYNGTVLSGQTVTWTSSDTSKATVSATGVVTARGTVATPHVTSIAPAQITPGATVTITGTGFATVPGDAHVTVAGGAVLVTAATATQLTVSVPADLPCTPTGPAPVTVTNALGTVTITAASGTKSAAATLSLGSHPDSAQQSIKMANQRTLAVGEALMITDPAQVGCNELVGTGARYLVDVYNDQQSPNGVASFEVRGAGGVSVVAARASRAASPLARPAGVAPRLPGAMLAPGLDLAAFRHLHDGHAERMARTVAAIQPLIGAMKAGGRRPNFNSAAVAPARLVIPQTVGATVSVKYGTGGGCSTFTTISARVVYVGTHSIVLEGSDAPLAGTIDSIYIGLAQKFDTLMYPLLTQYFGNPMAFDDSLSKVGKVTMLFTKKVNDESANLLGFVTPCDMFPASYDSLVPSSNHTEMFYARVPTSTVNGGTASINAVGGWKRIMGATLIHETKHVTAIAERFADPVGTSLEESWFEEGTAQVAAEMYARVLYGAAWKSDAGYGSTVYCDLRGASTSGQCAGAEYLMADQFTFLYDYMDQNELTTFLSPGSVNSDIYGSAWLFARWLLDQYSATEADLMKPLVRDATMAGIDNVTDKTGRSWDELDGYFTMMLAADDYPGLPQSAGARFEEPSWNLRDIFAGLHADDPADFTTWPLGVRSFGFGAFVAAIPQLAGGSAALLDISGAQTAPQLIDVHAADGSALPPSHPLRMVIVRIQ